MDPDPSFSMERFRHLPVVGILRGLPMAQIDPVLEAATKGGLTNLEITMNTAGAVEQIRRARERIGDKANIGAGTVTSLECLQQALDAGAQFIVTPTLILPVIDRCVSLGVPVFPGAFTPTEILQAHERGATMVKVFPSEILGPGYLRSLKAPMPQLRLMPTGGVTLENLAAFRRAGAEAFGVGSPLFRPDKLAAEDWEWLCARCEAFHRAWVA